MTKHLAFSMLDVCVWTPESLGSELLSSNFNPVWNTPASNYISPLWFVLFDLKFKLFTDTSKIMFVTGTSGKCALSILAVIIRGAFGFY